MSTTDLDKPAKRAIATQGNINPESVLFSGKISLLQLSRDLGKPEKSCRAILHRLGVPIERVGNIPLIDITRFRAAVERQASGTCKPPKRRRA